MENQTKKGKVFVREWQDLMNDHRTYVGLVPLLEDTKLNCPARILFHIISSFSYVEGYCFATNEALGARLGLKKGMVKQYLRELQQHHLIKVDMVPCRRGFERQIHLQFEELRLRYKSKARKAQ